MQQQKRETPVKNFFLAAQRGRRKALALRGPVTHVSLAMIMLVSAAAPTILFAARAQALGAGGDTTVVDPETESPVSILENAREPESPNIRLIVPSIANSDDGSYYTVVTSVTGGTLKNAWGGNINIGDEADDLLWTGDFGGRVDFWFTPSANRNIDASFTYRLAHFDPETTEFDYADAVSTATIPITPVDVAPTLTTANGFVGTGLTGTYYLSDYNLTGPYSVRLDPMINFASSEDSPNPTTVWDMPNMNPENYSVRWTGQFKVPTDGDYSFHTTSDDGVRLWIDGESKIDNWTTHAPVEDYTETMHFTAGSTHDIELDYYERGGGEVIDLQWLTPGAEEYEDMPTSVLFPGSIRPQLTYLAGGAATYADDGIKIHDVDSTTMTSAIVAIVGNFHSGEDSLQFTNQNGISGVWNPATGVLVLTGTASIADYQAALRSVKYYNDNPHPNSDARTVHFTVNDGEKDSNYTTRDIVFNDVNEPPVIIEGSSVHVTMSEDADPIPFSLTLDADDPNFQPISWSIADAAAHGNASVDSSGSTVDVHYTPNTHYFGDDSFVVQASDGDGGTDTITVHVTIQPFTDDDEIDTAVEDGAPNSGDANNDGTLDSKQSNVASFVNPMSGHYVAVAIDDECTLTNSRISEASAPDTDATGYLYPLGLMDFTANCETEGFTATVSQYYYNPPSDDLLLRKFINGAYQTVADAALTRTTIGGQSVLIVSYQATDGGELDADGDPNGVIVDPAGPAAAAPAPQTVGVTSNTSNDSIDGSVGAPNTGLEYHGIAGLVAAGLLGAGLLAALVTFTHVRKHDLVSKK